MSKSFFHWRQEAPSVARWWQLPKEWNRMLFATSPIWFCAPSASSFCLRSGWGCGFEWDSINDLGLCVHHCPLSSFRYNLNTRFNPVAKSLLYGGGTNIISEQNLRLSLCRLSHLSPSLNVTYPSVFDFIRWQPWGFGYRLQICGDVDLLLWLKVQLICRKWQRVLCLSSQKVFSLSALRYLCALRRIIHVFCASYMICDTRGYFVVFSYMRGRPLANSLVCFGLRFFVCPPCPVCA